LKFRRICQARIERPSAIRTGWFLLGVIVTLLAFAAVRRVFPTGQNNSAAAAKSPKSAPAPHSDADLVRLLLAENLAHRRFSFPEVVAAASGKRVIPLDETNPAHRRVAVAIDSAMRETVAALNRPDSPVRSLRRINEASRFFEDGLRKRLDAAPGLACAVPRTRAGSAQRSGYPDLRIVDSATGAVFYLDPKLVERSAWKSTLRTFYFAPKSHTLKITDDAVHLLLGIEHDGQDRRWTFGPWKLVDLSTLEVRLKAEFHASNADLYKQ
jgi:hypothetical protein